MKPTLHVVGLPWTETTSRYGICAYTQKLVKFAPMMRQLGYRVVMYAGEENDAEVDEHVPLISRTEREEWFGPWNSADAFSYVVWGPEETCWKVMNARAIAEISKRREPNDLLLLVAGLTQQTIAHALPGMMVCEPFVGYEGIWADFVAFESYAWMHYVYGKYNPSKADNGRWYDVVVPNYFDPDDFYVSDQKDDYFLFIGRVIERKGPHVAAQIAKALGRKLVIAGPGVFDVTHNNGETQVFGTGVRVEGNVEYVGSVDTEERAKLMSEAALVLTPTIYIEPFGGVAVESMLSGTPVVSTDWGAFTETVKPGVSGYRFRTLAEGITAAEAALDLPPDSVRGYALDRYSQEAVGPQFDQWFDRLAGLRGEGWTAIPEREEVVS